MLFVRNCSKCNKDINVENKYLNNKFICDNCKPNKEILYKLFCVERKTIKEIDKIYNLSSKIIKNLLDKYSIYKNSEMFGYVKKTCLECYNIFITNKNSNICDKCEKLNNNCGEEDVDFVICKVSNCNVKRINLVKHIINFHKITVKDYEKQYGHRAICQNMINSSKKILSEVVKKLWEKGVYNNICYFNEQNKLEKQISSISDNIIFVGGCKKDHKRLFLRIKNDKLRNPDFIIINNKEYLNKLKQFQNWYDIQDFITNDYNNNNLIFNKVIEFNGLHWHSKRFNNRTLEQYEQDMIEDYKNIGIDCLVIWDFELNNEKEKVYKRILNFIGNLNNS
jgi:hypothetical protein